MTVECSLRWRQRHKENGICTECSEKVYKGQTLCEKHREGFNQRGRERYKWLKSIGFCMKCGSQPVRSKGHVYCVTCNDLHNAVARAMRRNK